MVDTTIKLIGPPTRQQDAKGVWRTTAETVTEVFAQVGSVSRNEYFSAGRQGMRPEIMFSVFMGEYDGQQICEYNGTRYAIYRTYHPEGTDYLELYAQRETGVLKASESEVDEP